MNDRRSRLRREGPFLIVVALILLGMLNSDYQARRDQQQLGHHNREALVQSQRRGCQRAMTDRFDALEENYSSYLDARREGDPAATFIANDRSLMRRVDAGHSLLWPDPRTVKQGAHVAYMWPLGEGTFSCARAFPWPKKSPGVPFVAF